LLLEAPGEGGRKRARPRLRLHRAPDRRAARCRFELPFM